MAQKVSEKEFLSKFIPYLPQDAGYQIETHLESNVFKSNLTKLNDDDQVQ